MEADLKNLQHELRLDSWRLLFNKEMLGAVAVATGAVVEPVTTSTISIGLLGKPSSTIGRSSGARTTAMLCHGSIKHVHLGYMGE
jgi:hypothetical protein